jgi:hypothetical protein
MVAASWAARSNDRIADFSRLKFIIGVRAFDDEPRKKTENCQSRYNNYHFSFLTVKKCCYRPRRGGAYSRQSAPQAWAYSQREQSEQYEPREQYEQREQSEQRQQPEQSEQSMQFLQSIKLSSAFCAASVEPKYSTEHLFPLVSLTQVVMIYPHRVAFVSGKTRS